MDIEKAYDWVNKETFVYILEKIGFSQKIRNINKSMYKKIKSKHSFGDGEEGQTWMRFVTHFIKSEQSEQSPY